jgi:hypothetical protein
MRNGEFAAVKSPRHRCGTLQPAPAPYVREPLPRRSERFIVSWKTKRSDPMSEGRIVRTSCAQRIRKWSNGACNPPRYPLWRKMPMAAGRRIRVRLWLLFPFVLIASALGACADDPDKVLDQLRQGPLAPYSQLPDVPDAQAGWIVGSVGKQTQKLFSSSGSPYGLSFLTFRNDAGTVRGAISFSSGELDATTVDFKEGTEKSAAFAIKLPPGKYIVDDAQFWQSSEPTGRPCSAQGKLAIPFTVVQGRATYLGSLIASADWRKNPMGALTVDCGYFTLQDRHQRDEPVIDSKLPQPNPPIVVDLLQPESKAAQQFVHKD